MNASQNQLIVSEIFEMYERFGVSDYVGEPVSLIEHMSQSAQLAQQAGFDDEVILAAFFHDIGHMCVLKNEENSMGIYGTKRHEKIGADYLRSKGFSERIAKLVEYHVQAKRYLTFDDPLYFHNLSEASKKTLEYQGGKMNKEEALQFENDPLFEISILMRRWDEEAKVTQVPLIDLEKIKSSALKALDFTLKH